MQGSTLNHLWSLDLPFSYTKESQLSNCETLVNSIKQGTQQEGGRGGGGEEGTKREDPSPSQESWTQSDSLRSTPMLSLIDNLLLFLKIT
jgi:hypothetical protein